MAFISTTHFANRASLFQDGKLAVSSYSNPFMNTTHFTDANGKYDGMTTEGLDGQRNEFDAIGRFEGFSRETPIGREYFDSNFSLVKRTVDTPTGTVDYDGNGQLIDTIFGHDSTDSVTDALLNSIR